MNGSSSDGVQWYYAEGNTRRGPVDTAALLAVLRATADPGMIRVWREGMTGWERAGTQPELCSHLPPRLSDPTPPTTARPPAIPSILRDDVAPPESSPRLNPWVSMWTKPRQTIRQIVATDPERLTAVVAALAGVATALDRASSRSLADSAPLAVVLGGAVVIGSITGVIGLHIGAVLVEWTGQRLGGRGVREHIVAALAWGAVPSAWTLVPWAVVLVLTRGDLFTEATPYLDAHPAMALASLAPLLALFVMAIWSPFVLCKALGEVQGFSAWRALANIVLSSLVVGVPLLVLVGIALALR